MPQALATTEPRDGVLAVVGVDIGPPTIRLFDADGSHLEFIDFGTNPVWSFDGRYLAYEDEDSRIMVVEPPGGSSSVVYDPDDGFTLEEWSWAADSHTLLVQTRLGTSPDRHFVSFDVAGIEVNHVTLSGIGTWSPSGDHIVFSDPTIMHGCFECWAFLADVNGNTMPLGMRGGTKWAPDGSVLMALRPVNGDGTGGTELWLIDPYAETSSKMATRPILSGPSLSPDGRWIAVFGGLDIVRLIDVESLNVIDASIPDVVHPSDLIWSPTSELLLVQRSVQGSSVITALDLSLTTAFELPGRKAAWSPTGASIAFEGNNLSIADISDPDAWREATGLLRFGSEWAWQLQVLTDITNSLFVEDIEWIWEEGITRGCNPPINNAYCPTNHVTRGQMAAFLVRALDLTDQFDDPFSDDDGSIFEADIEKLAAAGITKGCNPPTNDKFCPDRQVTRGQMAAFLVRALGYVDDGGGNLFTDDNSSIFEADIDRLGTAGVTKGCNPPVNDQYCPTSVVTRGQMAAFLHRALG